MEQFQDSKEYKPTIKSVPVDWIDGNLPAEVETFSFSSAFIGYRKDSENGSEYAVLPELGFSISKEKLESVHAKPLDFIRVQKMADDPGYHGDGIVKIINVSKNESATIKDWESGRAKEWEKGRAESKWKK
jgi:hypothetical protein